MDKVSDSTTNAQVINDKKLTGAKENCHSGKIFNQDIQNLFDKINNIIAEEKGHVTEEEIEQLIGLLRNKAKTTQRANDENSEVQKFSSAVAIISQPDVINTESTMKRLEIITEKMSDYIIQKKGEIIEQDIVEIENKLRHLSSATIANKKSRSSNQLILSLNPVKNITCTSDITKNLKSNSIGNINLNTFVDSNNTLSTSFYSCMSLNEDQKDHLKKENYTFWEEKCKITDNITADSNRNLNNKASMASQSSKKLNFCTTIWNCKETSNLHRAQDNCNKTPSFNQKQNVDKKDNIITPRNDKKQMSHKKESIPIKDELKINASNNMTNHSDSQLISKEDHNEDLSPKATKVRQHWSSENNNTIIFKTTNYFNSVISINEKPKPKEETVTDDKKIAILFNKVIDVILEKYNILREDVEQIASLIKQNEIEKTSKVPGKEFIAITADIPKWALRGFLANTTGLTNPKLVSALLNKVAEYIVHEKGQILQSDRAKFCAILEEKILNQTRPKSTKNLRSSQTPATNLKTKKSELHVSSAKCPQIKSISPRGSSDIVEEKKILVPQNKETLLLSRGFIKNMKSVDVKKKLSIDAAIEEGIRSLEYIKQLSDRLLSDYDEKSTIKDKKTTNKLLPIHLTISRRNLSINQSLPFQTFKGKIKNVNEDKFQKKIIYSRNSSFKPNETNTKREAVKLNVSKTSVLSITGIINKQRESEQVNKQLKSPPKYSQSDNEKYKKNDASKDDAQMQKSKKNSSDPLMRCKTDVKRYIRNTSQALSRTLDFNNHSRIVNKQIRPNQDDNIIKLHKNSKNFHKCVNTDRKQEETSNYITRQNNPLIDENDEGNLKKPISQELTLKVSRTYSIFKPFQSNIKNDDKTQIIRYNPYESEILRQEKNDRKVLKCANYLSNFVREKYLGSKIPVRTLYLSKDITFCKK